MSQYLKDAKGNTIGDSRGVPLKVGQLVLYPQTVHSKGTRGSLSIGVIVGRDRYVQLVRDWKDLRKIDASIKWFEDVRDKKVDTSDWGERNLRGVGYHESISPAFLTVISERFAKDWEDGTIFDT